MTECRNPIVVTTAEVRLMAEAAGKQTSDLAVVYLRHRLDRGELRGRSKDNVRSTLRMFTRAVGDPPASGLSRRHVDAWLSSMAHLAPGTRRARMGVLRPFTAWLTTEGYVKADPCFGVKLPPAPRSLPRSLQHSDVAALLAHVSHDARARLMVLLMVQEGLRCCEVSRLHSGDIDRRARSVRVTGKGGHERVVWLTDESLAALERYEQAEGPFTAGPLIRSRVIPTEGVTAAYVSRCVSVWMDEAGVKRTQGDGRSAHALRHTMATDMLDHGAAITEVQLALGHTSLQHTGRYTQARAQQLQRAMAGRRYLAVPIDPAEREPELV